MTSKSESAVDRVARSSSGIRRSFVLRLSALAVLAAGLGWVGYRVLPPRAAMDATPPDVAKQEVRYPPTNTLVDATEVFQKAFWKRPTASDRILHAERREWIDGGGVRQWQWFIAVEPSPELVKHLREDNAFSLVPGASSTGMDDAPEWFAFKPGDVDVLQAPHGNMRLCFSKTGRVLYATDAGGGFRAGAPEPPAQPSLNAATKGRLPATHPPIPSPDATASEK